jgi:phytoene synthase
MNMMKQATRLIYLGSAEVVGLMCLKVFVDGNQEKYQLAQRTSHAIGLSFPKDKFPERFKCGLPQPRRTYFPGVDLNNFNEEVKAEY